MREKYFLQHDSRDCGATCLAMIASHYKKNLSIAKARVYTKTDKAGCNLYGIADAAKKISLVAEALQGSIEELKESINSKEVTFPFVAHIISDEQMMHFVVVYKMTGKGFIIGDPAQGKVIWSVDEFADKWTGHIVIFNKADDFTEDPKGANKLKRVLGLVDTKDLYIIRTFLLSLMVSAIGVAGSFVFKLIMDKPADNTIPMSSIFIAVIFLYILQAIIQVIRGKVIIGVSKKIDYKISTSYFEHLMRLPVYELGKWQTGEYMSRLSDITLIRGVVTTGLVSIVLDAVMIISSDIILFVLNSRMALVSHIIVLAYIILVLVTKNKIEKLNREALSRSAVFQSFFKEVMDGINSVKMFGADKFISDGRQKYKSFGETEEKTNTVSMLQDTVAGLIELVGTVIILWLGFTYSQNGLLTIGELFTFYSLMSYFITPVKDIVNMQPEIQQAFIAIDRLDDMMEIDAEDNAGNLSIGPANEWKISNVDLRYGNQALTLKNINMDVKKGEKIAIVGSSGCGKTSIAKMLMGFYLPEKGEITVDNENINLLSIKSVRDAIAYIGQDSYLFTDTIKNNIKIGNDKLTDDELAEICSKCYINDFVDALPCGIDTPIEENGANLSSGQRQRIIIARALAKHPKLLILDEATSNLDARTEQGITDTINGIGNDIACIIIAHRLSTITKCDRIYVMKNGEIIECGRHDELLVEGSEYSRLWSLQ